MLDNFARSAKLNPAWGSTVAKVAKGGRYLNMPYTVKGMDFTFTGLLTNAAEQFNGNSIADVAYSLQETAFSMLCEATERALFLTRKRELALCGGVAQSERLREMLGCIAVSDDVRLGVAPNEFNADNGAMIALVAEKMFRAKVKLKESDFAVNQKYTIDKTVVVWE